MVGILVDVADLQECSEVCYVTFMVFSMFFHVSIACSVLSKDEGKEENDRQLVSGIPMWRIKGRIMDVGGIFRDFGGLFQFSSRRK